MLICNLFSKDINIKKGQKIIYKEYNNIEKQECFYGRKRKIITKGWIFFILYAIFFSILKLRSHNKYFTAC